LQPEAVAVIFQDFPLVKDLASAMRSAREISTLQEVTISYPGKG